MAASAESIRETTDRLVRSESEKEQLISETRQLRDRLRVEEIATFLKHIVAGKQDEAEEMLKKTPALVLAAGDVTDHANKTFTNITGFQYAVWALDWHMWRMIRNYLPIEAAQEQTKGFTKGPWVRAHGEHANWQNLIDALQEYIDNHRIWDYDHRLDHWGKKVGRAQKTLPMHVLQEYSYPNRPFCPCPDFTDTRPLPRVLAEIADDMLEGMGMVRGTQVEPRLRGWFGSPVTEDEWDTKLAYANSCVDRAALAALYKTRAQQREELVAELARIARPRP